MTKSEQAMRKARKDLLDLHPFFGVLALGLELKETTDCPVMAVDGVNLYYNPNVSDLPHVQTIGVVAHEVLHCAFQHMFRRDTRDHQKWNMATDYVINSILLKEAFSLPSSRLYDSKYDGMSAEKVYSLLPDPPGGNGGGQHPWDFGSVNNSPAQSASEQQALAKQWEISTKQAAMVAKKAGKLPADLGRLVDEFLTPQVPWRQILWNFFMQRKPGRFTWNRPNRRFAWRNLVLPSRKVEPTGDVVIAGDTSGSITRKELNVIGSEINDIIKTLNPENVYVIWCDSRIPVNGVQHFDKYNYSDFKLKPVGGGGTDFRPPFKYLADNNIHPDCMIYMTDGYGPFPEQAADFPVLWMITNDQVTPPWGEHFKVSLEDIT